MNGKRVLSGGMVVMLVLTAFGLAGQAQAQDPTPEPDRAVAQDAGFELVGEIEFAGRAITQVAAAPDGSTICAVTDDTLLTCTDRDGKGGFTYPAPNGIIAILIGLYSSDVVVIQRGSDANPPVIASINPAGQVSGSLPLPDALLGGSEVEHFIARMDPRTEKVMVARAGGNQIFTIDVGSLAWSISGDADDRPTEEITLAFAVRDMAVMSDGSLVAVADDGQVFRASPGGAFSQVSVATGDVNGDGVADIITNNASLIGGQDRDWFFLAGQRSDPVSGDPVLILMRLGADSVEPVASWKIEEGERAEPVTAPVTFPLTGWVLGDGSVLIGMGASLIYRVDPDGTVKKLPLVGDDVGALVMFKNPAKDTPSLVRFDASTPKLQEFILRLR